MNLLDNMGHVESCFSLFRDSVSVGARLVHGLRQRTMGSEIASNASDGAPGDMGHVESCSSPFGDKVSVSAR
jgi:hypothetical protein